MKIIIYFILFTLLTGCLGKKEQLITPITINTDTSSTEEKINIRPKGKHIPIYSKNSNYSNTLSKIASEIHFVKLDDDPLLRDFFISDVQLCNEYIFLQGHDYIYQYDLQGNFIKQIGSKGQGPGEYIGLNPSIQIDCKNKLIYANDLQSHRSLVYNFDGTLKKSVKVNEFEEYIYLLDSVTIAVRTPDYARFLPHKTPLLLLQNSDRKTIKSFMSHQYPISKENTESFGSQVNPLWQCRNNFYMLEYGNDTIYQITDNSLIPSLILTGEQAPQKSDLFKKNIKNKAIIAGPLMKPNSYIFESDRFLICRIISFEDRYFSLYDKKDEIIYRTGKQDISYGNEYTNKSDYFIDDIISGIPIDPLYQSNEKAIGIISTNYIIENKANILQYISNYPSKEGENLKNIIDNINEMSNSILFFINFK